MKYLYYNIIHKTNDEDGEDYYGENDKNESENDDKSENDGNKSENDDDDNEDNYATSFLFNASRLFL